ncbi:hypothetical protein [Lactococcus garvieae]|uniref:hypothetical protein n=1 Tax=Lactococcus garvieae TaxID=1363 RepID=UPI00054F589A|nr:hypothetical protein [Lactococcus garvieae]
MTGLKDIKPVATLGGEKLYSAEQMQEYAKANCWELINWYVETTGDVNHAAEMKIWMDDEFGGHEK